METADDATDNGTCTGVCTSPSMHLNLNLNVNVVEKRALAEDKIKSLVDNPDLRDDERNLVVLVLLARAHCDGAGAGAEAEARADMNKNIYGDRKTVVSNSDPDPVLECKPKHEPTAMHKRQHEHDPNSKSFFFSVHLFNFCIRLLGTNQECFVRLVALVLCLLEREDAYNWNSMARALLSVIKYRSDNLIPIHTTDAELMRCLLHCVAVVVVSDNTIPLRIEDFDMLWERFGRHLDQPSTLNSCNKTMATENIDPYWRFVEEAISSLHQGSSSTADDDERISSEQSNAWKQPFVHLWHEYASRESKSNCVIFPPSWYESMVMMVVSSDWDLPIETTLASQEMVFQTTKAVAMFTVNLTFSNPRVAQALADLIMAHLGSSQSRLRMDAIEACSLLVSRHGWNWVSSTDQKLNQASHLCTWTRLAAGEFRLQLEIACDIDDDDESTSFQENALEASRLVIVSAMSALSQEARNADDGLDLTLDPEALLHLRQSFFNALQATISYFEIVANPLSAPSKVLGSLLSEFSIWDDQMPDGVTIEAILCSVKKAMCTGGVDMLPCLANLLASAEEDITKAERMGEIGILGDNMTTYFTAFWTEEAFLQKNSVPVACSAVESWFSLVSPAAKQTRPLARLVLQWIKTNLSDSQIAPSAATPLMSAVGCYVVLMGDRAPPDHEAKIVETVLAYYAKANDYA